MLVFLWAHVEENLAVNNQDSRVLLSELSVWILLPLGNLMFLKLSLLAQNNFQGVLN